MIYPHCRLDIFEPWSTLYTLLSAEALENECQNLQKGVT
jgi:hypothetical protein